MQWISKNIGTISTSAPEAYCSLFSMGYKFEGSDDQTFYQRMAEIWDDADWEMKNETTGFFAANYNGDEAQAIRAPYIASIGRFCTFDSQTSGAGGVASRGLESYYGPAVAPWDEFPFYSPYEARSTGSNVLSLVKDRDLLFGLNSSFLKANKDSAGFTVKVVFAAGNADDEGKWQLSYYDGDEWTKAQSVTFDPDVMEADIYTATFYLDGIDFSNGADSNDNHLKITSVSGDHAQFLHVRIIPIAE